MLVQRLTAVVCVLLTFRVCVQGSRGCCLSHSEMNIAWPQRWRCSNRGIRECVLHAHTHIKLSMYVKIVLPD